MSETILERPADTVGDLAGRFVLGSGSWALEAEGGKALHPVFADAPREIARELVQAARDAEDDTGRSHVVCGLIPFDLAEPAQLRLTGQVALRPRTRNASNAEDTPLRLPELCAPDDPGYRRAVRRTLRLIEDGTVDKVVLSRIAEFSPSAGTSSSALAAEVCERLAAANRNADVFSCPDADGALWVGASPEVIADVRSGRFLTHPLAGSLSRTIAREQAAERLRSSDKDLREHAYVVDHIRASLSALAVDLSVPDAPSLFATDSMWHLGTRICGDLRRSVSALEAAVTIHPTPAVCGSPSDAAAVVIREAEAERRQFYSGLVGWTDSSGDGRWSLVLRGAKISPDSVRLQAGAGIVAGSDPDDEHAETGAKFATMLRSLDGLVRSRR